MTPSSRPAVAITILKTLPGAYCPWIARFMRGVAGSVESRVGFRVMMRASGTITAALAINNLTATYRHSWNPLSAGTIRVRYSTTNDGSVAVTGAGRVTTAELFGLASHEARAEVEEMLPGGRREADLRVAGVWALGSLRTSVDLTPAVRDGSPAGAEIRRASATVTVWALPWPQMILAAILGALVLAVRTITRRRRQRFAQLLARAREEGRAAASRPGK